MKNRLISALFISSVLFSDCTGGLPENAVNSEFKVWGNCGMCKKTIESSLEGAPGIVSASWDKDTKMMSLVFDTTQTNVTNVQKLIASSGYDTEMFTGDNQAYSDLHECCKYERK